MDGAHDAQSPRRVRGRGLRRLRGRDALAPAPAPSRLGGEPRQRYHPARFRRPVRAGPRQRPAPPLERGRRPAHPLPLRLRQRHQPSAHPFARRIGDDGGRPLDPNSAPLPLLARLARRRQHDRAPVRAGKPQRARLPRRVLRPRPRARHPLDLRPLPENSPGLSPLDLDRRGLGDFCRVPGRSPDRDRARLSWTSGWRGLPGLLLHCRLRAQPAPHGHLRSPRPARPDESAAIDPRPAGDRSHPAGDSHHRGLGLEDVTRPSLVGRRAGLRRGHGTRLALPAI